MPASFHRDLGEDARGVVWYRAKLPAPGEHQRRGLERTWLRFESVATDCRAWVNGVEIGRHIGDFIPFEFELTDALSEAGGGELIVRVDQIYAPKPAPGVLVQNGHIGKGFHDVVSLQHGGIWGDVGLRVTGPATIRPGGIAVLGDAERATVRIRVEFAGPTIPGQTMPFSITDPDERPVVSACMALEAGIERWEGEFKLNGRLAQLVGTCESEVDDVDLSAFADTDDADSELQPHSVQRWSPESPRLYELVLDLCTPTPSGKDIVETYKLRYGFRTVETGGHRNQRILLNGRPILLRGMLHWGHEPEHIAPAPTPAQVRAEFARLKELGFNCVCLCMVYPPEHYYDIADEVGMLIWQEHPVWKSPMGDEHIPEYRRLFAEYFRRDRNHPSVILVSGACEHERFNPTLAEWWWDTAQRELPGALKQVQTAFFGWSDLDRTDLYDEHTYENSGRWTDYVNDVRAAMKRLPQGPKPFVLGETIISNAWPDVEALTESVRRQPEGRAPWWMTGGLKECSEFEARLREQYGEPALQRFRRQSRRHNLNLRQLQCEVLRLDPGVAGWVMNHLRDVPICRCGFMDDLGSWRYEPHELREFLGDVSVVLETDHHLRGFAAGETLRARVHLSNFGPVVLEVPVGLRVVVGGCEVPLPGVTLRAGPGEVASAPVTLGQFRVDRPTRAEVIASAGDGRLENRWSLWMLPAGAAGGAGVHASIGSAFTAEELAPEFEEKGYSSGWGLPVETWSARAQRPDDLLPEAARWHASAPPPGVASVVVSHRLTAPLLEHLDAGGRALLLASRLKDGLLARTMMLWSGVPLVIEFGPLGPGDSEWVVDLLHHDLTRRYQRAIPTGEMGIADHVQPIIRFLCTHDSGLPRVHDFAFATRVGRGLLAVSSLDHYEEAGRYWLSRVLLWLRSARAFDGVGTALSVGRLRELIG